MARTHYFPEDRVHYVWDNEVEPGDTVVYRTREVEVVDRPDWIVSSYLPLALFR